MRVRGLKLRLLLCPTPIVQVAPHAGAWIEMAKIPINQISNLSHPMRVRGLKLELKRRAKLGNRVAPHAGAWIEMAYLLV